MNKSQTGAKLSGSYYVSTGMVAETGLKYGTSSNCKYPPKYIFQFVEVRPNFVAQTQTENMLTC